MLRRPFRTAGRHRHPNRRFIIPLSFDIEKERYLKGYAIIAGVDEAGRGALAGPLALGFVVYSASLYENPPEILLHHVNDSKALNHRKRLKALDVVRDNALHVGVIMVSHRTVDRLNVNRATEYALKKIVEISPLRPDLVIMDGKFNFDIGVPFMSVVGGDAASLSIASASVAAKVRRDEIMVRMDTRYPGYDFSLHKGYGTALHRRLIADKGPSPIHRRTYEPLKSMLNET